jgi:hypothetical protein
MNHSRIKIPSHEGVSPEKTYVACPDCNTPCLIRLSLLCDNGKLVHIAICGECADHVSIRAWVELTTDEWKDLWLSGVPVVHYEVNNG